MDVRGLCEILGLLFVTQSGWLSMSVTVFEVSDRLFGVI